VESVPLQIMTVMQHWRRQQ